MKKLLLVFLTLVISACQATMNKPQGPVMGAEKAAEYLPLLAGKRVGLLVNQTSTVEGQHLLDFLLSQGVDVKMVFAPEHGFRGEADAGEHVADGKDSKTGVPIVSIYGKNKKPATEIMQQLDWVIFDIQDVGTRFYTYISSMHYMMEAAAENSVRFMVLDRPNPNGRFTAGFVREEGFTSFVGMHPIPVLHGMTVGELAQMINGEGWLADKQHAALTVVTMDNYQHSQGYDLPIKPSPNLPNSQSIQLYPHLCLFEPTHVSVGRGTPFPFQVLGHPTVSLGDFQFTPVSTAGAKNPKWKDAQLTGMDLRSSSLEGFDLSLLVQWYQAFDQAGEEFFTSASFFDKLAGTDKLRKALEQGLTAEQINQLWQADVAAFKQQRQPYMLYP